MASGVWKYFKIEISNELFAKCYLCKKLISRGGGSKSTSNLMKHLKTHKIDLTKSNIRQASKSGILATPETSKNQSPSTKPIRHTLSSFVKIGLKQKKISTNSMDVNSIDDELVCDEPLDTSSLSIEIPAESQCSSRAHLFDKYQSPGPSAFSPGSSSFTPNSSASSLGSLALSPCASLLESVVSEHPKVIKLTKKTKQVTLPDVYDRMRKFQHNDYRAKQIDELIAKMICIDFQPISLVDNKGFQELLNHLEPRYTIPSRKTFANKILRDMYTGVSLKIKSELLQAKHIAITTDMWTSIANVDYMAVTAHFYKTEDHTLTLTHKCLEVVPFPEVSHTADNLKNFLVKVLREWEISNKVVAVVRDNGADISAALERSQYEAVSCVAHTLQLVVKDGLMDNPKIKNIIKKAKQIVGSFKHSAKNTKLLKDCQRQLSLPVHRMITDEPTRWNSTLHMLRRLQEQKDAIILLSSKSDVTLAAELTNEDWKTLEYAVDILEMFEVATLQVSKESSCISEIVPLVHTLHHVLENKALEGSGLQGLKNDLVSSLKRRYPAVESNLTVACATLLDPRFKSMPFKDNSILQAVKNKIIEEMKQQSPEETEVQSTAQYRSESHIQPAKKGKGGFWTHYEEAFGQAASTSTLVPTQVSCEDELRYYLQEKTIDPNLANPVGHIWLMSPHLRLQQLALKYLCIPPSTVFSERLFSTAGNICDAKRNRLDPDRVKMLVFLNKNLK